MKNIILRGIRNLHTVTESCPRLTKFSLHPPKTVKVEYNDGSAYVLSAEYLRIHSPAVDSKIRSIAAEKVICGRRHVGIMSAAPVGNYGVSRRTLISATRHLTGVVIASVDPEASSSFTFSSDDPKSAASTDNGDHIFIKSSSKATPSGSSSSATMPMSFMTGSIVGKRFYERVTTREADDGNGWTVMLDYRTLKSPSKRTLRCLTLALAKAIAAEWEYQLADGIRPFTMPLMRLACTALERVPLTRPKIIENLMVKFNQDLVFCRAPGDNPLTSDLFERQAEKLDPLLRWVELEFGFKPTVHSSFFGGKQEEGLINTIENLLQKTNDSELAAIDAIAASAHSLIIAIGIFRGQLNIEQAIELIRLEEDLQVERWGMVEAGHDVDIADLRAQISSATVFLGLSRAC